MLRHTVWKQFSHYIIRIEQPGTAFVFWNGIALTDAERHRSGRVMVRLIYCVLLVNISAPSGQTGG
jgi:hypothetical protein